MENPVIIFGAGPVGQVAMDIFIENGVIVFGFLDDDPKLLNTEIGDINVMGQTDDDGFLKLIGSKCEAFVAIENKKERQKCVEMLIERRKVQPVNAIHKNASVSEYAALGHGNYVGDRVVVETFAEIENYVWLQAGAIIGAHAQLADHAHIGPGAVIGAHAKIGKGAFVGAGAVVVSGIEIAANASVGAGSVVIENVPAGGTVFGNPAKKI